MLNPKKISHVMNQKGVVIWEVDEFQSARWLSCWSMRFECRKSQDDRCDQVGRSNLILTTKWVALSKGTNPTQNV